MNNSRWKGTSDFIGWILKERTPMCLTNKYLNGADYYIGSTTERVCLTEKEFNWVWYKIYD